MNGFIRAVKRGASDDRGFTIVELMITLALFSIIAGILLNVVFSSTNTAGSIRTSNDLNEEARLVLNRMSREIREGQSIVAVSNPAGSTYDPAANSMINFEVDFDGDGAIEPTAADPEVLTYTFEVGAKRLLLQAGGLDYPILAGNVKSLKLSYSSVRYECDVNADGTTTWEELDTAPSPCPANIGNNNNILDTELVAIDAVTIDLTMLVGGADQIYRTQVDMRNRA